MGLLRHNLDIFASLLFMMMTFHLVTSSPLPHMDPEQLQIIPEIRPLVTDEFDVSLDDVTYDVVADYVIEHHRDDDMYADELQLDYQQTDHDKQVQIIQPEHQLDFIALPATFTRYDLNGDGYVTALELADATGTELEDSVKPFRVADVDDDGLITEEELLTAPWVFAQIHLRHDNVMT